MAKGGDLTRVAFADFLYMFCVGKDTFTQISRISTQNDYI